MVSKVKKHHSSQPVRRSLRQKGVALLMVLATLSVLSAVVVEFAYHSNVTYNLAINDLDRTQAYYLAQSGLNFSKLVLKFDKEVQKVAKDASKNAGQEVVVPPLYEMIPIDTALFRAASEFGALGGTSEAGEEGEEESSSQLGLIDLSGAEEFLDFQGDFAAQIREEDAKLNLNAFYNMPVTGGKYDRFKATLYHLLATPEFAGMFDDRYRGAKELAQNIVDFIDKDEVYNELEGQERGREANTTGAESLKNAKLLSVEELALVPGMSEPVFQKLKNYVTAYGSDEKVWVCRAEEPLVRALILAYTDNNPKMEPIKDDNEELLSKATELVLANCPSVDNMGTELDKLFGANTEGSTNTGSTGSNTTGGNNTTGNSGQQNTASQSFSDLVKDTGSIYTVVGIGTVGESEVKLKSVLDISNSNPRQWKEIYWRVE